MPVKLTALSYLGLATEATLGTPVAPTAFIPIRTFKPADKPKYVPDEGFRGLPVQTFGNYLGPISSTYDVDGDVFPTSFGTLIANLLGMDTVSGTATPYTHKFQAAATPGSLTLSDYYVAGFRQWAGMKVEKCTIKFTPQAGLTHSTSLLGFPSVTGTAPTTQTYAQNPFFLGWEAAVTINGTADSTLMSMSLDIQRVKSESIFAATNSQKPVDTFVGPLEVNWDLEFYMESDTEYLYALTEGGIPVSVTLTQPGTNYSIEFTSSSVQFTEPTIDRSKDYVVVQLKGVANYSATDAGNLAVTLINGVSSSYTTTAAS